MFKITLSNFNTKKEALNFLKWYEGQGEQDESISTWTGARYLCDMHTGLIEYKDGYEYKIRTYYV